MKKLGLFLFIFLQVATLYAETFRIGYIYFEPYVIFQGSKRPVGGPVGEYWEQHLLPEMGVSVEWVGPLPLLRMLKYLSRGELDAMLLFPRKPELAREFLYPGTPFFTARPGLTVREDSPLEQISRLADLAGLKISYVQGGLIPAPLEAAGCEFDFTTKEKYVTANLEKLLNRRVDGVFNIAGVNNTYEANKFGYLDRIKTLPLPLEAIPCYTVFAATPRGRELLAEYESVNKRLVEKEIMQELIEKYLPENYR